MAEVIPPTHQQRAIADMRARGLRDEEIIILLGSSAQAEPAPAMQLAPAPRNNGPWYVCGAVVVVLALISFAWSMGDRLLTAIETLAEQNVELARTATTAAAVASDPSGNGFVWLLCIVAVLLIMLGLKYGK